ncbi:MAG: sigma-70 family RNA polymerase sigma factor [Ignavibacteria bacterium]|nr:sigma-70 family RNA polymerase sigma factor [Ignavibacteria bacterium]
MPDHPSEYPQAISPNGPSDDVLITMYQGGDALAFRTLVDRHRERVRNVIYSVLNAPDLVDDIAQEVFIKAYQGLPQFRFDSSFYTWLYRITINRCRDEIRRKKVRRIFSLQALLDAGDPEALFGTTVHPAEPDVSHFIQAALQRVPERFRIPVILRDIDGLSYTEIAEVLECEAGTVKSRIARGRLQLRELLEPLLNDRPAAMPGLERSPDHERTEHDVTARPA